MNLLRTSSVGAVIVAALSFTSVASAQQKQQVGGFALNRFDASERGSDWFSGESLDLRGHGRFNGGAVGDYSHDALVTKSSISSNNNSIVSDQLVLNLGGNVILWNRLRVGLNLPVAAYSTGESASSSTQTYGEPKTTAIGDLRVSSDVRVFGEYGDAITGAVGVAVHAPTGRQAAYMSDGTVRMTPRALLAGKIAFFEWSARGGFAIRPEQTTIQTATVGNEVVYGATAGVRFLGGRVLVGPEVFGGVGTDLSAKTNAFEAMLGAHGKVTDSIRASFGAGAGLSTGFGVPGYRMMAGIEWAPGYEPKRPPPAVEPERKVEPPPPPPPSAVAQVEEEPLPKKPADRDNDMVADVDDKCPDEPGPVERDGCPVASIQNGRIVIAEQIKFRTGSAELDPASDPILGAVGDILTKHPELALIRIEGHTDNKGLAKMNVQLSKDRAAAVAKWLSLHSIDSSRLKSAGFGASQPLASNATEEGRRENRRVEFHIVEGAHASR